MGLRVTKENTTPISGLKRPGIGQVNTQLAQEKLALQTSNLVGQAAKQGIPVTQAQVAQAGTAATEQLGKEQTKAFAAGNQRALQAQAAAANQQKLEQAAQLKQRAIGLLAKERDLQAAIFNKDKALGEKLFTAQMDFAKDEMGREIWQTRQMLDWAVAKAHSDEDLMNLEQNLTQQYKRKMQILAAANAKIEQALQQKFLSAEQEKDQALKLELTKAAANLKEKIKKEQAEAAMWSMIISEGTGIAGAIAGGVTAGPTGAAAGYGFGKGLGSLGYGAYKSIEE